LTGAFGYTLLVEVPEKLVVLLNGYEKEQNQLAKVIQDFFLLLVPQQMSVTLLLKAIRA
jgi:hypothetical protein